MTHRRRRGSILIIALWIVMVLAGTVLVFARSMRVEATASANTVAAIQAGAIERGAEQYLVSMIADYGEDALDEPEESFAGVQVGDGYFWVIRPNYGDDTLPIYGLVDEASKLNINSAEVGMLEALPGMSVDAPAAIVDWRSSGEEISSGGAKSEYYLALPRPYDCKNGPFETVEELLLVRGVTPDVLYGVNPVSGQPNLGPVWDGDQGMQMSAELGELTSKGIFDYVTVYSNDPPARESVSSSSRSGSSSSSGNNGSKTSSTSQRISGRVNINTAPREVLLCLGFDEATVNNIISQRVGNRLSRSAVSIPDKVGDYITYTAKQFSADIVAVSGDGRAFRRCRIVIDSRSSPPRIMYRRELTDLGWPMDREILDSLRQGTFSSNNNTQVPGGGAN